MIPNPPPFFCEAIQACCRYCDHFVCKTARGGASPLSHASCSQVFIISHHFSTSGFISFIVLIFISIISILILFNHVHVFQFFNFSECFMTFLNHFLSFSLLLIMFHHLSSLFISSHNLFITFFMLHNPASLS